MDYYNATNRELAEQLAARFGTFGFVDERVDEADLHIEDLTVLEEDGWVEVVGQDTEGRTLFDLTGKLAAIRQEESGDTLPVPDDFLS
jgi:hypothetical protein